MTLFPDVRCLLSALLAGLVAGATGSRPTAQGNPRRLGDLQSGLDAAEGQGLPREGIRQGRHHGPLGADRLAPATRCSSSMPARSISARPPARPRWSPRSTATRSSRSTSIRVRNGPRWSSAKDSKITKVEDLKGKKVAMVRGTDPHIFLVRALLAAGLTDKDITPVLVQQHADGGTALIRGDVDAWAGLDPDDGAARDQGRRQAVLSQARGQHLGHPQRARGVRQGQPGDRQARDRGLRGGAQIFARQLRRAEEDLHRRDQARRATWSTSSSRSAPS